MLYEENIVLLVRNDNALAEKEMVSFDDIKDCGFIIESSMFKLHDTFTEKCRTHGFEPQILFNTSGFMLCHKLCAQGKGVSLTLQSNSNDMIGSGLKLIPFDEEFKWQIYMITKKGKKISAE